MESRGTFMKATNGILQYVLDTKALCLTFLCDENMNKQIDIAVISDASRTTEYNLRSRGEVIIWIGKNLFQGFSKKSSIICETFANHLQKLKEMP